MFGSFFSFPFSLVWFISCLAETTQTPFDFEHNSFKCSYCIQSRTEDLHSQEVGQNRKEMEAGGMRPTTECIVSR
jgi:NADH dehydrogenase.